MEELVGDEDELSSAEVVQEGWCMADDIDGANGGFGIRQGLR